MNIKKKLEEEVILECPLKKAEAVDFGNRKVCHLEIKNKDLLKAVMPLLRELGEEWLDGDYTSGKTFLDYLEGLLK